MSIFKQLLKLVVPIATAVLADPLACHAQGAKTERAAPILDVQIAQPLLVVADLAPGDYFAMPPKGPECSRPGVVCLQMGPPQFSLIATIKSTIYGKTSNEKVELVTHSHWGMQKYRKGLNSVLVMLKTDGQVFQMPKYAEQELVSNTRGDLFLPIWEGVPTWWLPCSADALKEEITSSEFETSLVIPESHGPAYLIQEFPALFRQTENGIIPRYAISIAKLKTHLNQTKPSASQMSCKIKMEPEKTSSSAQ